MKSKFIQITTLIFSISLVTLLILYKSGIFDKKQPITNIQPSEFSQPDKNKSISIEKDYFDKILPSSKSAIIFEENQTYEIDTFKLGEDFKNIMSSSKSIIIK